VRSGGDGVVETVTINGDPDMMSFDFVGANGRDEVSICDLLIAGDSGFLNKEHSVGPIWHTATYALC